MVICSILFKLSLPRFAGCRKESTSGNELSTHGVHDKPDEVFTSSRSRSFTKAFVAFGAAGGSSQASVSFTLLMLGGMETLNIFTLSFANESLQYLWFCIVLTAFKAFKVPKP